MAWVERYVRADADGSGDGTTDANSGANGSWTFAQAVANYAAGQRVNIKAGSYTLTSVVTLPTVGTTTAPVLFRGYKTTIGDMDTASHGTFMSGTETPAFSMGANRITSTSGFLNFANVDAQSSQTTSGAFAFGGVSCNFERCRIEGTAASAGARAINLTGADSSIVDCWLKSTTTASSCIGSGTRFNLSFSTVIGGASGITPATNSSISVFGCIFDTQLTRCITVVGSNSHHIIGNVFCNSSGDGIEFTSAPLKTVIAGNIFSAIGGIAIDNSTGTDTANVNRIRNAFYSITTGQEAGFGDTAAIGAISLSADPFVDAASGDFNINSTAGGGQELRDALVAMPELSGTSFGVFRRWLDPLPSGGGGSAASVIGSGGLVF